MFNETADSGTRERTRNSVSGSSHLDLPNVKNLCEKFSKQTTVHGIGHALKSKTKIDRIVWTAATVLAIIGAVSIYSIVSTKFVQKTFEAVIENTTFPVYLIPFPKVSICNRNRLNWKRIDEAKQKFLSNRTSNEKLKLFERFIGKFDRMQFGTFDDFEKFQKYELQKLNELNLREIIGFMSWQCEEIFDSCWWRNRRYPCCAGDIVHRHHNEMGICFAFNGMHSNESRCKSVNDAMWPWRSSSAGVQGGLAMKLKLNSQFHLSENNEDLGLAVMVHQPTSWHGNAISMRSGTYYSISIQPVIEYYENQTRSYSPVQRKCLFDDERNSEHFRSLQGFVYLIENCYSECRQQYLMRYCNCTVDLLFPPGPYPSCRASDFHCLAKNNHIFSYMKKPGEENYVTNNADGMVCQCFRNCYSLNYIADVRPSYLPTELRGNLSYVEFDVHFRFETMMVYRTSLVFGWVDLLVSFGGIAGLFLGCSILSAVEIVYFVFVDIPNFIYEKIKYHKNRKSENHQIQYVIPAQLQRKPIFLN